MCRLFSSSSCVIPTLTSFYTTIKGPETENWLQAVVSWTPSDSLKKSLSLLSLPVLFFSSVRLNLNNRLVFLCFLFVCGHSSSQFSSVQSSD